MRCLLNSATGRPSIAAAGLAAAAGGGGEAAAAGFLRFVRHNVTLLELPALGTAIEGASPLDLHAGH